MDFLLSQLLLLAEPIGLTWLGLLAMTVLAWWRRQCGWALACGALAILLYAVGSTDLAVALLRRLERPYFGYAYREAAAADAVVMLGGGVEASPYEVGRLHLTRAGDRLSMALELIRLGKAPVLVLGGGGGELDGKKCAEADLLKQWVDEDRLAGDAEVLSLGLCANTHDEALRVSALAARRGWKRVLLVTSASHLRRALATFAAVGVPAEPAPCNFLTTLAADSRSGWRPRVPSWSPLEKVSVWLHEEAGWYEYRRRGWIRSP